jgi:2-C-methyl-D-erythritol 4-phosphate cytidylyltransferase
MLTCECEARVVPAAAHDSADTTAVIVAGGLGTRLGIEGGKQLLRLAGKPVVCWSVEAFDRAPSVKEIVVVCPADELSLFMEAVGSLALSKEVVYAPAGDTRQDSVRSGLACVKESVPYVAVHDGARPLIRTESIEKILRTLREQSTWVGAIAAFRSIDTVKVVGEAGVIESTPAREMLWCVQTPQCFETKALLEAHAIAELCGNSGTDDSSLVEAIGGRVGVVETPRENLKITVPEDLVFAEATLAARGK